MKQEYQFYFLNDRYKYSLLFKWVFVVVNIIAMTFISFKSNKTGGYLFCLGILVLLVIDFFTTKKREININQKFEFDLLLWWVVFYWVIFEQYWIAAACFLVFLAYLSQKKFFKIFFSASNISLNSFPKKSISYTQLQNIVLKDGLLTIDFKNNKIIQASIITSLPTVDDEASFNQFCQQKLTT